MTATYVWHTRNIAQEFDQKGARQRQIIVALKEKHGP